MKNIYVDLQNELRDKQATWLVTGAAGFIGSHLVENLLLLNQKVIGIDNFSTGSKTNIEQVLIICKNQAANFTFQQMDIQQAADCRKVMFGVDFVLHHAAMISVPESIERPDFTNAVNITGFLNILCAAREAKVKRFVYASSSAVYGNVSTIPIQEHQVNIQLSPYGLSKYVNELYAQTLANCYHMETIGLRYFNVFGPRQDPNGAYAAVIPRWIRALIQGLPVPIFGDGETSRDFCYISNIVQANLLAATTTHANAINQVFNIATGSEITLNKLLVLLKQELALENVKTEYNDFRPGDIRRSIADISKAITLLNYQPTHDLQSGLREAMQWYHSTHH